MAGAPFGYIEPRVVLGRTCWTISVIPRRPRIVSRSPLALDACMRGPRRMRPRKLQLAQYSTDGAVALRGSPGRKRPGERLRVTGKRRCARQNKLPAQPDRKRV